MGKYRWGGTSSSAGTSSCITIMPRPFSNRATASRRRGEPLEEYVESERWKKYRPAMFDFLQAQQNKDGSWPGGAGLGVGPVYTTAVWCIVLQLDHRAHPSRRHEQLLEVL